VKTFFDVQQLLKKFGTFIYTGDKNLDYELIQDELRELFNSKLIDVNEFQQAVLIVKSRKVRGE
jgi:uncharacterized protein YqgQ